MCFRMWGIEGVVFIGRVTWLASGFDVWKVSVTRPLGLLLHPPASAFLSDRMQVNTEYGYTCNLAACVSIYVGLFTVQYSRRRRIRHSLGNVLIGVGVGRDTVNTSSRFRIHVCGVCVLTSSALFPRRRRSYEAILV